MFERLQQKWKVGGWRLLLILVTFALGGSLCGYIGRKLLLLIGIEHTAIRIPLYIILVTVLWPLCVLLTSIPLGQFVFFRHYLKMLVRRITRPKVPEIVPQKAGTIGSHSHVPNEYSSISNTDTQLKQPKAMISIAIFASGAGSNAARIIEHFRQSTFVKISLIVCNKPGAGVLDIAARAGIPTLLIEKEAFFRGNGYVDELQAAGIDFIVLAGFLWKVPASLTAAYPNRIVNIHPALLPRYGGKGMYGKFVHEAIIAAKEAESGITIHYVDNVYDNGAIIFQATCTISPEDTPETLAQKVHQLEHAHYPEIIEQVLRDLPNPR